MKIIKTGKLPKSESVSIEQPFSELAFLCEKCKSEWIAEPIDCNRYDWGLKIIAHCICPVCGRNSFAEFETNGQKKAREFSSRQKNRLAQTSTTSAGAVITDDTFLKSNAGAHLTRGALRNMNKDALESLAKKRNVDVSGCSTNKQRANIIFDAINSLG